MGDFRVGSVPRDSYQRQGSPDPSDRKKRKPQSTATPTEDDVVSLSEQAEDPEVIENGYSPVNLREKQ